MVSSAEASMQPSQPSSIITLDKNVQPRAIQIIGVESFPNKKTDYEIQAERESVIKLLTYLSRGSLIVAAILFLCQTGAAVCLCRPVAVLGGVLVALMFLCQGVLGRYVVRIFSQTLLVGYSCLSGFVSLIGLASALYLLSGQFSIACISSFHTLNAQSMTRLRIVESISLIESVPCLMGAIACFLSAALSARASKRPKRKTPEPQLFLYLHPSVGDNQAKVDESSNYKKGYIPTAPGSHDVQPSARTSTPPPSYNQANEESYA